MIARNLVDVLSLLASTKARDEISALVDTPTRIEARHETRCEEAMSTSLHSKKKEARKIEPPQINNECIEKALIQLTGVVMEVGYLLVKCILVVLVFFGLAFLVKSIWSSCKTEVRLGSCVGVGLTSGTVVEETDYRQNPTSPAARWLKLEKRRG